MKLAELYQIEFCKSCNYPIVSIEGICPFCSTKNEKPIYVPNELNILNNSYKIEKCIGIGGMGNVYQVQHLNLKEIRALKVMRVEYALEEEMKQRFLREAKILASVDTPFFPVMYDFGIEDDLYYYIIMEYVDGIPLKIFMDKYFEIPFDFKLFIIKQILESISFLHSKQIVHRDLSLDNILMLKKSNANNIIKILDFGLGKNLKKSEDITRKELFFGKFLYAPPEYFNPTLKNINYFKVDVYSLGVIAYVILAGKYPIYAKTTKQLINLISSKEPDKIDGIDSDLMEILLKALSKDFEKRYDSAKAFLKSFNNYISSKKISFENEKVKFYIEQYFYSDNLMKSIEQGNYKHIIAVLNDLGPKILGKKLIEGITNNLKKKFIEEKMEILIKNIYTMESLKYYSDFIALTDLFIENLPDELKEILSQYELIIREYCLIYQIEYYLKIGELKLIEDLLNKYEFSPCFEKQSNKLKKQVEIYKQEKNKLKEEIEKNIKNGNFMIIADKLYDIIRYFKEEPDFIMSQVMGLEKYLYKIEIESKITEAENLLKEHRYDTAYNILNNIDISRSDDENINNLYLELLNETNRGLKAKEIINEIQYYFNNGEAYKAFFTYQLAKKYDIEGLLSNDLDLQIIEELKKIEKEILEKLDKLKKGLSDYDLISSKMILDELISIGAPNDFLSDFISAFEEIKSVVLECNKAEDLYFSDELESAKSIVDKYIEKHKNFHKLANLKNLIEEKISSKVLDHSKTFLKVLSFLRERRYTDLNNLLFSLNSYDDKLKKLIKEHFLEYLKKQNVEEVKSIILNWLKKVRYDDSIGLFFDLIGDYFKDDDEMKNIFSKYDEINSLYKDIDKEITKLLNNFELSRDDEHKNVAKSLKNVFYNKKYDSALIILKMHLRKHPNDKSVKSVLEKLSNFTTVLKKTYG